MKKLSPLVKGIITGSLMVITTMVLLSSNIPDGSPLQYLVYDLYAGGIMWTLIPFSRSSAFTGKFSELFGQGFRCYVIATLIMVAFIGIYSFAHPELAEEQAVAHRKYLQEKKELPTEIETQVQQAKDNFVTTTMYSAVFGTMIIGTIFTLAGSALVLLRRKSAMGPTS